MPKSGLPPRTLTAMTDPTPTSPNAAAPGWVRRWRAAAGRVARGVLRACIMLAAFMLMLGALIVGLLLVLALMCWSLLRGRRPAAGVFRSAFERSRRHRAGKSGQVIDVEVREVPDPALPDRRP